MDDPLPQLSPAEVRVLGSLIEKQITTPDYYPLTLNALTNASNQLTNRDPVVAYDDQTVVRAVDALREKRLATLFHGAESRVAKYRHSLGDVIPLSPPEIAVLCVLLLRGPQTVGELRTRTERMHGFESLADVEATLEQLAAHQPPLVVKLPRQPGTKESRYTHLFSGPVDVAAASAGPSSESEPAVGATANYSPAPGQPAVGTGPAERIATLEQEIAAVRRELAELRQQFADFRKQFE